MNKKLIALSILFLAVVISAGYMLANGKEVPAAGHSSDQGMAQATSGIILFYGDGCPHCALVEEYVSKNGIEATVPFVKKEVYHDKQNASELAVKAQACGMPTDSIGVPFLWTGATCIVGDQPIIDFFKEKIDRS
jgi:glutaredoxin